MFGFKAKLNLTKKVIEGSFTIAQEHADTDGDPRSYWGLAQGMTRYSQTTGFADERTAIDSAAGKLLRMAF